MQKKQKKLATIANGFEVEIFIDRRNHPRYCFTAAAEALDANSTARMTARTTDLSRGGCYVDTFSPFPLKTEVKIRITKESTSFITDAHVVYSKVGMGMGLEFTGVAADQAAILEKWLEDLEDESEEEEAASAKKARKKEDIREEKSDSLTNTNHTVFASDVPAGKGGDQKKESGYVLGELILVLRRKGILTEEEGRTMLSKLMQHNFLP